MAKKLKQGKHVVASIRKLIEGLQSHLDEGHLCDTGRTRLEWWKRNGHKFPSIKAAMKGWDVKAIQSFFGFLGIDYEDGDSFIPTNAAGNIDDAFAYLNDAIDDLGSHKFAGVLDGIVDKLKAVQKQIDALDDDEVEERCIRETLKSVKEKDLIVNLWKGN